METNESGQRMPSVIPIRAIWDDENDSEIYLGSTATKDELAREFDRLFSIKFLFFQKTLDTHKLQLRYSSGCWEGDWRLSGTRTHGTRWEFPAGHWKCEFDHLPRSLYA